MANGVTDLDPFAGVDLSLPSGTPQAPAPVAAPEADPFAGIDLSLSSQAAPSVRPIDSSDPFAGIDLSVGVSPPADADFLSSLRKQAVSIPGLAIQDGKFAKLPDSLPSVASPELAANAGELSLDQLNSELRRASYKYSRTRDIEKRTQILGEFIQNWNPEKAKELGIGQDGYIKPTGLWKVLDLVDIVFDRPVRVLGESLYEYKETQAANTLQGKDTSIKQLASLLSQNWDEDRGRLGEGGQAIKSWALWATSPLSIDTPQEAQEFFRRSDAYDAGEQELADSIVTGWHRLAGTVKGKSRQEIEQIVDESIAQGAQGGQATIDLVGMMGASLLNLVGLGPFKGALTGVSKTAAARRASNLGLKYNPLGNARLGRMEVEAMPRARAQMIEDLTGELRAVEGLPEVSDIAAQSAVRGLRRKSDELAGIESELLSLRKQSEAVEAGRLEGVDDAVLARSIDETADRYKAANEAFEEEFLSLAKIEGTPVSSGLLFDDIQARAARMAAWDVADATEMSLRYNIKSGAVGARAASILAEAKLAARAVDGEPVLQVERLWADAMENAEKGKKVLVDLGLDLSNPAKPIAKPVFMTSSEARVFENAKDGVYGMKAQVASYYPQDMGVMVRSVGGEAKFKSLVRQAGDEIIRIAEGPSIRGVGRRAVKRGVQAARGMSKSERIFDADRMITNVEPFSFKINHAIASQIPWIERFRVPVAGVLSMTRRPMHYARKGEDGKWVRIERNEMVHPTRFYRATLAERQRLTDMSVLRSEWPVWRAKMEAVGGDMAIINMGRKVYELGWASPEAAMATADDLLKVVAIENLQKVADELARMGAKREVVLGQGRVVTVLPAEDIEKARSSIAALDGVNVNTSELSKLIDEYEEMTTPLAGELAILSESEKKARAAYIENLRSLTNNLYAATQASVLNRVKFQSELAVGKIADDFVPELDSISKQINSIDEQLSAIKVTGEGAEEALSAAKSQLDEAFRVLGLGADDVGKARLLREMDPYVSAYRGSLSDFKKRMGDELGEEAAQVADEALTGARAAKVDKPVGDVVTEAVEGKHPFRLASVIESGRYVVRDLGEELDRYGRPTRRRLYEYKAKGTQDWPAAERVTKNPDTGEVLGKRKVGNYDPKIATVSYVEDEFGSTPSFTLKEGFLKEIPQDDTLMYRGMSWEEFESIQKSGQIKSRGEYNLGPEQEGLTYFTSDASSGTYYASGYAPVQYKPVPEKPAVVVSVRRREGVPVSGTAEHEIGIRGSIAADEIVDVWVGRPYQATTGKTDVIEDSLGFRDGSGVAPTSRVAWKKEGMSFSPSTPEAVAPTVRASKPLSDTAQAYIDSVRVAWAGGKEVPVLSLFDSMWDNARAILDPSLLGRKSMFALKLPGGVKKSLNELAESSRAVDAARINVAEASPATLADAEATLAKAVRRNNDLRGRYGTTEVSMPRPPKGKDLVHAPGSDSRQVLEALRLHYTNRMASINAQVATEAHEIRVASTDAIKELQERLTRQGLVPEGKEKELSEALQRLSEAMFGREVSVSLAGTKDLSADILLRRAVSRSRRVKDPAARAQILSQELGKVQARLAKVGDEKNISDLQRALNEMDELRAKKKSMKEVKPQFTKAVEQEIDNLLKKVDELDFDLRHPDDASRQLIGKLDSAYNNLEAGAGLYQARLRALRDADVSDLIPGMSAQQKARVVALLKNPKLRNKLIDEDLVKLNPSLAGKGGRTILVKETQAALAAARTRLDKYIADGAEEAIEKQRGNVARLERELEILGTEADVDKVLQVAELMKRFFDENLERLKTSGVLDEAFNADEFFARVDVGAYFPHMLSQASRKRFEALGAGSGARVGRTISNYFSKKREIGGVVDDINEAGRAARAEKILHHAAKNGEYGEAAASAAARGQSAFKAFVKESGQDYATLVDEIKEGALLSQFDELFETDPFVVMDYYHRKASQAVADARFINTTLDLFPAGRLIAQLPVNEQAKAAESMGYVRLSEVEYLEATLQQQLPKGLRSLTPTLKAHVASGASLEDIKKLVFAELGSEIDPDILTALSSNKIQLPYVPVQIKEYLNWRNSADALIIKKTVGSEVWDGLQAWAKTQATVVALAHIGRNFIGNTISTVQELGLGAINPFTQMTAMRIWGTWGDKNLNQIIEIGGREMTVKGWREFFSSRGFFDNALSTDFLAEMGVSSKAVPTNQTLVRQLTGTSVGAVAGMALGSAFGMGAPGFFFGGALGMKAGKKWSGVKAVRGDKAYKRFQEGVVDELKNSPREGVARVANEATGAIVGGIIGSATTLGLGTIPGAILGKQSIGDFIQMMGGLNRAAESQARLSTAIGLMKRGVDPDEALVRVNRSLRDYSDLTPLEKGVFRRFFFFYTWEAGNIKYQLQWMRERPRTVRALSAFTKGVYQMQFTDEELANLPETYRYPIVVRSGAAKLIALSGLPHQPMLEVLTRQKEGFPMQGLMTRIHPAILSFLELMAGGGRSFYYGRPIKELNNINQLKHAPPLLRKMMGYPDSPNYYVPIYKNGVKTNRTRAVRKSESPVLYYLAQKLPGYRWMNEYFKISSDSFNSYALESALTPEDVAEARATHFERAMMFGFGLKQTAIDWDYESYKMSKEFEERMLDQIEAAFPRAVGTRRYLRKELSARPSPDLEELE